MAVGDLLFSLRPEQGDTPAAVRRKRELAEAIMGRRSGGARNAGEGIGNALTSIGDGISARVLNNRANASEAAGQASANDAFAPIASMFTGGGFGGMGGSPAPSMSATPSNQPPVPGLQAQQRNSPLPASFLAAVDRTEGAGGYDTLYGHAQRKGPFAGTDVSKMSIGDVMAFTDPSGQYAQTVKGQIGRVATPVGRHQIVGTTLRNAARELGLDPSTPFDANTQDMLAGHLATKRVQSAGSMPEKISALRSEWHGFNNVPDSEMAQIVSDLESGRGGPFAAQPGMAATADIPMGGASAEIAGNVPGYVDPMVSAPNSPPQPPMAPQQGPSPNGLPFDLVNGSPQLARADTRQGILRALTGQTGSAPGATGAFPAAPGSPPMAAPQAAPAPAMAQPAPMQAAPAPAQAPQPMGQPQVSTQQLIAAINNPWLNDSQRAIAQSMLDQQMQANDPMRQLQIQKLRQEVEGTGRGEIKIAGDRALLLKPDGTVEDVTPALNGGDQPAGFRYSGKSVEAQALNGLIDSGQLTPEQAQQLGAGKTITGPNGEIIFMTPQGVFGQPAGGGQPQPISAPQGGIDIFAGTPQQAAQSAPVQQQGMIPLTEPKVTVDEKKAMTFADRMTTSGAIIDSMGMTGSGMKDKLASGVPLLGEYLTSDEYKKVDQAKRDFINAQLRRESGAVISPEEFDNAEKQYFPQPNDPPEVVEQKRRNREIVISGMARDSGPTYKAPSPQPTATMGGEKPISEMTDAELEALANGD